MSPDANRVVVVGGASGIGLATARLFRSHGRPVTIADVDVDAAGRAAGALAAGGDVGRTDDAQTDGVVAVAMDVTDERSVAEVFAGLGDVRTVVNCAGLSVPGALTELELSGWRQTVDVCLTGTFLVIKHAGRHIAPGGSITTIASLNGRQPGAGMGAYCAAKAGVLMLVQVAALELAERGVRVNAVSPGLVDTPLVAGIALVPGLTDEYIENTPLARSGRPDEIAAAVAYLASDEAGWMTGSTIELDGGAHLMRYPDVLGKVRSMAAGFADGEPG
ncbi:SDR family NAD(P)-dependent oxidoreductase [Gordonia soli]|uniref:Putative oxidoreductase n=1 Tax=Gordonia soli NBRC 108243 TaxID=1223545 RepID=M0QHR0_9ACTN|nr:SDR family oxidoreductase [Gordonia soli]GAC67831.1 putative oxidoreductase [Gordonia soli NBRC 108243]